MSQSSDVTAMSLMPSIPTNHVLFCVVQAAIGFYTVMSITSGGRCCGLSDGWSVSLQTAVVFIVGKDSHYRCRCSCDIQGRYVLVDNSITACSILATIDWVICLLISNVSDVW